MKIISILLVFIISANSLFANAFKSGYYYTKDGKKVEGFIKFRRASFAMMNSSRSDILFKENKDSSSIKLTTDDISSFVIGTDSFAIIYNFKINSIKGEFKEDFAEILISGKMNLFMHMSSADNPAIDRYVLSKDNHTCLGIWNAKQQREQIAQFFSDDADLKARILNKEFDKHIPELVMEYNKNH